jgi:predicted membrane channel-forming protein YqfA (hemolysin III family)
MQTLRLILGIPAIVLVFLPYVWGVSPWYAVREWNDSLTGPSVALLGLPFFLALPIFMADVQRFLKKNLPKQERLLLNIFAYAAIACLTAHLILGTLENDTQKETVRIFLLFGIPLLLAVSLIWLARRLGSEKKTLVTLRAAWLPNALVCTISFWSDTWQIGAYLAALTIVVYGVEVALFMAGGRLSLLFCRYKDEKDENNCLKFPLEEKP